MPVISVIVPIYNAEKYLEGCIQSVLNQTYRNFELILIDDGSQDNSYKICKNYENGCNTAKEIFKDVKDNCKIGWDFIKKLVSSGTSKLKDWYEVYSGK